MIGYEASGIDRPCFPPGKLSQPLPKIPSVGWVPVYSPSFNPPPHDMMQSRGGIQLRLPWHTPKLEHPSFSVKLLRNQRTLIITSHMQKRVDLINKEIIVFEK